MTQYAFFFDQRWCTGCRNCYEECPYGAPVFESDNIGDVAQKCDMAYSPPVEYFLNP